jgi:hypothetical protein
LISIPRPNPARYVVSPSVATGPLTGKELMMLVLPATRIGPPMQCTRVRRVMRNETKVFFDIDQFRGF